MLCGATFHVSQDFAPSRGSTINGCQAGTRALLNFQMDLRGSLTLPCSLSDFPLFASFGVSQAVLFTCFSFCCFTLWASLTRLPINACSGCQRVLVLFDSSWRKVWSHARPGFRMSHPLCVTRILLPFSNVGTMVTEPSIDWLQTRRPLHLSVRFGFTEPALGFLASSAWIGRAGVPRRIT